MSTREETPRTTTDPLRALDGLLEIFDELKAAGENWDEDPRVLDAYAMVARYAAVMPDGITPILRSVLVTLKALTTWGWNDIFSDAPEKGDSVAKMETALTEADGLIKRLKAQLPFLDDGAAKLTAVVTLESDEADPIRCPDCGHDVIYVVQVTMEADGKVFDMREELEPNGFYVETGDRDYRDHSTHDEIAECSRCGRRGNLAAFGFGAETEVCVPQAIRCEDTLLDSGL